ncbi:MAG: flagellar motor protein MotB [Candidatus Omnitrophica bacterium]|nr:flagellar motor protein MotB [Candidatus Omnitrophota bacterium]
MKTKGVQLSKPSPAWMLTYGDMVTLILVFFVLLFTLSDINIVKFSSFFKKMKKPPVVLDEEQLRRVMLELANYAQEKGLEDKIGLAIDLQGLTITLTESIMFRSGQAVLMPEALPILDVVSDKIINLPNPLMIEGHTDNIPIRNEKFPSNWELSLSRAVNVLKYLIEKKGVEPARISAAGYAEYRPVASNDTPEGRAGNRRVVLVVLRQEMKGFESKPEEVENGN